ncbi:MAG TPA: type II toxin-antitoxin system VapC family toxin [Hanamia sp.]
MKIYLDTSSLFKLYQKEPDSENLGDIFYNTSITGVFISEIAKVEFVSALFKKVRMQETDLSDAQKAIRLFDNDFEKYIIVPVESNIFEKAKQLILEHGIIGLRTLDAIQLASAIEVKRLINKYFTADKLLSSLFEKENLPV